jgi:hypothetical protein
MRLDIAPQESDPQMTDGDLRLVQHVERFCLACGDRGTSVYCRRCHARTIVESVDLVLA